jgi:hypothetical protein
MLIFATISVLTAPIWLTLLLAWDDKEQHVL